jgi:hypothetical protein
MSLRKAPCIHARRPAGLVLVPPPCLTGIGSPEPRPELRREQGLSCRCAARLTFFACAKKSRRRGASQQPNDWSTRPWRSAFRCTKIPLRVTGIFARTSMSLPRTTRVLRVALTGFAPNLRPISRGMEKPQTSAYAPQLQVQLKIANAIVNGGHWRKTLAG